MPVIYEPTQKYLILWNSDDMFCAGIARGKNIKYEEFDYVEAWMDEVFYAFNDGIIETMVKIKNQDRINKQTRKESYMWAVNANDIQELPINYREIVLKYLFRIKM